MDFGGEIFETILMFLVIIFLLDSRIWKRTVTRPYFM
jgi:hypothetical protein